MFRQIEILIDDQSWKSRKLKVPSRLAELDQVTWSANIFVSLLFTALCTRPPVTTGLHLSDFWAWLRYRSAISTTPALRLCEAWGTIDSHQKTILSDELGVGITTHLLAEKLDFLYFADTLYAVDNLFQRRFTFREVAKNGRKKSPDYIGFDQNGDFFVLECKGTQSSRESLQSAIKKGGLQKNNLHPLRNTKIKYKLVAGLFIPQWIQSRPPWLPSQESCIILADPSWEELEAFFNEIPANEIKIAIVQIALAKHLSLIGLVRTAAEFAETPTEELVSLREDSRREIYNWISTTSDGSKVLFDSDSLLVRMTTATEREKFWVRVPQEFLLELAESRDISGILNRLSDLALVREWRFSVTGQSTALETPLGFQFMLEVT